MASKKFKIHPTIVAALIGAVAAVCVAVITNLNKTNTLPADKPALKNAVPVVVVDKKPIDSLPAQAEKKAKPHKRNGAGQSNSIVIGGDNNAPINQSNQ